MYISTSVEQKNHIEQMITNFVDFMPSIKDMNPALFDAKFHHQLEEINQTSNQYPQHRDDMMQMCFDLCGAEMDKSKVHKRARYKPCGYAGDYMMIDWLYMKEINSKNGGEIWDYFLHRLQSSEAVRNRLSFFCEMIRYFAVRYKTGFSVLDLASGPCRDVFTAVEQSSSLTSSIHFHCVDLDENAIEYSRQLLQRNYENVNIQWEHSNAFFIKPTQKYDFVWSAGLFDYLNDRLAAALLKKMWRWTKDNGYLVIGNYHKNHATRNHLEWCGQWFLIHRDEDELLCLSKRAGIPEENCSFYTEHSGSCVFLMAQK